MLPIVRERRPAPQPWDIGSLGEALREVRMFGDELIRGLKERRFRAGGRVPPFQVIDKLKYGALLRCLHSRQLARQRASVDIKHEGS